MPERPPEASKNMRSVARTVSILALAAFVALAAGAGSARATTTCMTINPYLPETCFDPDTGTGFAPVFSGWTSGYVDLTRAEELKLAKTIRFWYGFYHEEEYLVTCSGFPQGVAYVLYRTQYDLAERVVVRNGGVAGWKLLGRNGAARTSVTNTLENLPSDCTVDGLNTTYDFVLLYMSDPSGGPARYNWRHGEGVCFLASSGDPYAC